MDATDAIARRFPLVARPRPACTRLDTRVGRLCSLAEAAERDRDPVGASSVYNQAALLASDVGLPDLARQWSHQHAAAYLSAHPLSGQAARHGLEPVVNLARLKIRAGDGSAAYDLLTRLYQAVTARTDIVIDGLPIPAATLTATHSDHEQLRQWLWAVLLADGTRALTDAGRWHEAHEHLRRHNGIGQRLFDGLQVAILAHCLARRPDSAFALLRDRVTAEPWEGLVAACLTVLCHRTADHPVDAAAIAMRERYLELPAMSGLLSFHTRLGLTVIDLMTEVATPAASHIAAQLARQAVEAEDGKVARDILAHDRCRATLTRDEKHTLISAAEAAGLGAGAISPPLLADLRRAVKLSETVIRRTHNVSARV